MGGYKYHQVPEGIQHVQKLFWNRESQGSAEF